jgi:subtilisin family serine protease
MRSSNSKSSIERTCSRLPLTLTAIVAVLALTVPADAGWFGGRGFGGGGFRAGGFGDFAGHGGGGRGMRIMRPGNSPGAWGRGAAISDGGRSATFKNARGNHQTVDSGSRRVSDGGSNDGNDRPSRPRHPRIPPRIVSKTPVIVPSVVTAVTAATSARNAARAQAGSGGGQGGKSTGGQSTASRTGTGVPPAGERRYVPDEVLIQLASTVPATAVDALARNKRLDRLESFDADGITMFRWRIPDRRSVSAVVRSLEAEGIVVAAQPNYLYRLQDQRVADDRPQTPASPAEGDPDQYALTKLRLPQAHALAKGDDVLVAVIDSGVDVDHPELAGMVSDSYDALASDEKPHAHGTGVAGAIVAHARLMGAAPKARILAIRAFGRKESSAEATSYSINKGLVWAMAHGARVINMSFTGPRDPSIAQKLAQARGRGIVLIAAAGNAGPKSDPLYPAAYADVIAVTATDADDKLFAGANRGKHIAVAAPGVDLLLPAPEAGYQVTTGTSFAAAEVSGVVALLLQRKPDLGHEGVRQTLTATARDLGPKGVDRDFGAGLVDAYAAIRAVEPAIATTGAAGGSAENR